MKLNELYPNVIFLITVNLKNPIDATKFDTFVAQIPDAIWIVRARTEPLKYKLTYYIGFKDYKNTRKGDVAKYFRRLSRGNIPFKLGYLLPIDNTNNFSTLSGFQDSLATRNNEVVVLKG